MTKINQEFLPRIESHLKKIEPLLFESKIKGIDRIFLINLDGRPQKLENSLRQLTKYQIQPNRFSGIYGWTLPSEVFDDVGLKCRPGMNWSGSLSFKQPIAQPITKPCDGSALFYPRTTRGHIGHALSLLSILQHVYNTNEETIWILEDDFVINSDPHALSEFIEQLDTLVDRNSWDILYTDDVTHFAPFTPGSIWRPDIPNMNFDPLFERINFGEDFFKIGGRCQTHSLIIRRSGIKKILDYVKNHGLYLPFDLEIAFVPAIRLFNLKHNIVWGGTLIDSDTIKQNY